MLQSCELTQSHRSHQLLCRLRVPLAAARSFCVRRTEKTVDTHMFPYIASTLLYRLHRRETQPALLSTAALSRQVESKLLDRAGSGSGHNYTVPGRWSAGALELRSSVSLMYGFYIQAKHKGFRSCPRSSCWTVTVSMFACRGSWSEFWGC